MRNNTSIWTDGNRDLEFRQLTYDFITITSKKTHKTYYIFCKIYELGP
jgi:hypothetical protein